MKVSGTSGPGAPSGARRASRAGGDFRIDGGAKASASSAPSALAPAHTLSALIALQSGGGGRAKALAAARRALELLDRLRMGLLEGAPSSEDLEALERAASQARADESSDPGLAAACAEIELRARVELAKRGR
jgi:hypothetical protein